jgi:hypothetical protein
MPSDGCMRPEKAKLPIRRLPLMSMRSPAGRAQGMEDQESASGSGPEGAHHHVAAACAEPHAIRDSIVS